MSDSSDGRFQRIGSLTTPAASLPQPAASMPDGSTQMSSGSAITIVPREASLPISPPVGAHGSGMPTVTASPQALALVASAGIEALRRNPAQLLSASLQAQLAQPQWVDGDDGHGWDGYVIGYTFQGLPTPADLAAGRDLAAAMVAPGDAAEIGAALTRLRYLTVARQAGEIDLEITALAYTAELSRYPTDVVIEAIEERYRRDRYWPALEELLTIVRRLMVPREALATALERGFDAPPSPGWIAPTPDQVAESEELLRAHGLLLNRTTGKMQRPDHKPMTPTDKRRMADELAAFRANWERTGRQA